MNVLDSKVVEALHPHWRGNLRLSATDNVATHEGVGSTGRYELADGRLTVYWDAFEADEFLASANLYIHRSLLPGLPDISRLSVVRIENSPIVLSRVCAVVQPGSYEVGLRLGTTDSAVFGQIFVQDCYGTTDLPPCADTIVDLGANIGLSTVFFAMRYPGARILAVEPEDANFAAMVANTAALGDRVQALHGAAWITDGHINLHTENETGASLGAWGVRVSDRLGASNRMAICYRMGTLLAYAAFDTVDILKVDIEGAELDLFADGAREWLPRVKLVVIETHDRFRPGSDAAVRAALLPLFEELPRSGENLIFRRIRN